MSYAFFFSFPGTGIFCNIVEVGKTCILQVLRTEVNTIIVPNQPKKSKSQPTIVKIYGQVTVWYRGTSDKELQEQLLQTVRIKQVVGVPRSEEMEWINCRT